MKVPDVILPSALDSAMEAVAKEHQEQPFCFTYEPLLNCPCCGGSSSHTNLRGEDYPCGYCKGQGAVRVSRI